MTTAIVTISIILIYTIVMYFIEKRDAERMNSRLGL